MTVESREHLDRKFRKPAKKDARQMEPITRKIEEMARDPHEHKPLHFPFAGKRRVHIGGYVLLFSVDEARKTVVLEDYEHHDRVHRT